MPIRCRRVRALVRASHPEVCTTLTLIIFFLALTHDVRGLPLVLLTAGAFAGQLSIGWSNDLFDAERDAAAGRWDKPLATGSIGRRAVAVAAVTAFVFGGSLCLAVTPLAAAVNLVVVIPGWLYNAGLKSTLASGLMYILGFGAMPQFSASASPGHPLAAVWETAAAALLGVGGHFANTLPDLALDRAVGVGGLPQRVAAAVGERAVRLTAFALLVAASCVIVFTPHGPGGPLPVAGLTIAVSLGVVALLGSGRLPFIAALAVAAVDVGLFALRETAWP
jgi:4-hydroxybenzoate polyprenyltransferase